MVDRRTVIRSAPIGVLVPLAGCGSNARDTAGVKDSDGDGVIDSEDYAPSDPNVQRKEQVNQPTTAESSSPPLKQIQVSLKDVRAPSLGLTSATIPVVLEFNNPTSSPISDISGDVDAFISGTRIATHELTLNKLEAGETTLYEMDIFAEYTKLGGAIVETIKSGSFKMYTQGELVSGDVSTKFNTGSSSPDSTTPTENSM